MRCFPQIPYCCAIRFGALVLTMLWGGAAIAWAGPFPPDPVDALRRALHITPDELERDNPDLARKVETAKPEERAKLLAQERTRVLNQRVDALRSLGEMRRGLLLNDWGTSSSFDYDRPLESDVGSDLQARDRLLTRFRDAVERVLRGKDVPAQLAVMDLLAVTMTNLQADTTTGKSVPRDPSLIGRNFSDELADLVENSNNPQVRAAAARTLGLILPNPQRAAKVLGDLLRRGSVPERQAAARGLLDLARGPSQLSSGNQASTGRQPTAGEIIGAPVAAVPAAAAHLSDPDGGVRRLCAQVLGTAASILENRAPQATPAEGTLDFTEGRQAMATSREELAPLIEALVRQGGPLAKASNDPDLEVRLASRRALEEMGTARQRLQGTMERPPQQLPTPRQRPGRVWRETSRDDKTLVALLIQPPEGIPQEQLARVLRQAIDALTIGVSDQNVAGRLAAIDALETFGPAAAPAVPALNQALRDRNLFVRWSAARTLGLIGPVKPKETVAGLARLLHDPDLDVRMAASVALSRLGPVSRDALPDLVWALKNSDAEMRVDALHTMAAIGTSSQPALPVIAQALRDPDERVRIAAAEVLGKFGPLARNSEPALRAALLDPNPEVRRAAADALLSVLQAGEAK
jgi:HEAT repeat protein